MVSASDKNLSGPSVTQDKLSRAIVRRLTKVGCACAPDLANELPEAADTPEVERALAALEQAGVVKLLTDRNDTRAYNSKQRIYELVR